MGLKLIKNIDTQWALSKQRNFLGTKQATAKLGGEAGTASPAEPEAQAVLACGGWLVRCQLNGREEKNVKKQRLNVSAIASLLPSPDGSAATLSLHGRGIYLRG